MTALVQRWTLACTIGGVATSVFSAHASYGTDQPVSICSLMVALPLGAHIVDNAAVIVTATKDGGSPITLFTGTLRLDDPALSVSGAVATLNCEGPNYRLTYPFEADVVYAGGAKTAASSLFTTARHLGTATITWYATDAPTGTTSDVTATPAVDTDFVYVAGRIHGSNSYDTSIAPKRIVDWSRLEVRQSGAKIGYANLPESLERWDEQLDYTNDANWEDFEVFVAAPIRVADGTVTFRFISGHKRGTTAKDEFEVKNVTWQTAAETSVRAIVRGLKKRAGLTTAQYRVNQVTSLTGGIISLGGNGLIDAGQVRMTAGEQPIAFINRVLSLFGFRDFDCPDGITRTRPLRGAPSGTAVATFTEGTNIIAVPRSGQDPFGIANAVVVDGATGITAAGVDVAYSYETASPAAHALIPNPPGVAIVPLSDQLLVSTTLCSQVGAIAEANYANPTTIEWESWPVALKPGDVVTLTAPTVGVSGNLFVTSLSYDVDTSGARMRVVGWTGAAAAVTETEDPNPDEADSEPTTPRPANEWTPYRPLGSVA